MIDRITRWEYITHDRWASPDRLPRKVRRAIRALCRYYEAKGFLFAPLFLGVDSPELINGHRYRVVIEELPDRAGLVSSSAEAEVEIEGDPE